MARFLKYSFIGLFLGFLLLGVIVLAQLGGVIYQAKGTEPAFPVDCALVFGSAVYGWNTPGPAMIRRTSTAARLYNEKKVKTLIFSGGRTSRTDQSEATVMQNYALRQGVPASAIRTEENSHSTLENLENSKPLTKNCQNIVAISDGYHLARIDLLSNQMDWGTLETFPADDTASLKTYEYSIVREVVANLYYGFKLQNLYPLPETL